MKITDYILASIEALDAIPGISHSYRILLTKEGYRQVKQEVEEEGAELALRHPAAAAGISIFGIPIFVVHESALTKGPAVVQSLKPGLPARFGLEPFLVH